MYIYSDKENEQWFREEYKKSGKKMDMGKSCVRFKKLNDLPLELIGKAVSLVPIEELIRINEKERNARNVRKVSR